MLCLSVAVALWLWGASLSIAAGQHAARQAPSTVRNRLHQPGAAVEPLCPNRSLPADCEVEAAVVAMSHALIESAVEAPDAFAAISLTDVDHKPPRASRASCRSSSTACTRNVELTA